MTWVTGDVVGPTNLNTKSLTFGGSLFSTYNAAEFLVGGSKESQIQASITSAIANGIARVYVPANLRPYSAQSITFDTRVQMIREGGDWSLYDIIAYGADNTGVIPATSAASGMYAALPQGSTVYWPTGTYLMRFSSNGSPLVSINTDNITTQFSAGATLRAASLTTLTTAQSEASQYVFAASGRSGIIFDDGVFDGNRSDTTDPSAGFFKGVQCRGITVRNVQFQDCSNAYGGIIQGEAYNGASSATLRDWLILNNTFYRSSFCINVRNLWYGVNINGNYFESCDLEAPQSGYSKLNDTAYSRVVRFTGYVVGQSNASSGPIGNAVISNNLFNRVSLAIEVWNQDATNGRNPDYAELITIQNNAIYSLWGIGVNSFRDVSITGNSWKRLKMSTADILAYPGYPRTVHSITSTGGVFGTGIEARPGYGHNVTGNVVDGQWVSGESPDLTGSVTGIQFGNTPFARCEALIASNYVQRCFDGMNYQDTQNTHIVSNTFTDNRDAITGSVGTNPSGFSSNVFRGNFVSHNSLVPSVNCCTFVGEWNLEHNTFQADVRGLASAALVRLNTTADRYRIIGNTFLNFTGVACQDSGLTSTYVNNYYDAGTAGSSGAGAVLLFRQTNKAATFHNETFVRCRAAFISSGTTKTGESYIANGLNFSNCSLLETVLSGSDDTIGFAPALIKSFGSSSILLGPGSAVAPTAAFGSEVSLGWYRSGVSTMALSYGSFNLNQARFVSIRTQGSLDSTTLAQGELAVSIAVASGASLALRSGTTIYYWTSSASTKG